MGEKKDFQTRLEIEKQKLNHKEDKNKANSCLLYTSPSPRDPKTTRMPSSA